MSEWADTLSADDFAVIAAFIERETGIRLPEHKRTMVQVRVGKRVRALGLSGFTEYVRTVFGRADGAGAERRHLIDVVTTNKTEFFRESDHFDYLVEHAIPALVADDPRLGRGRPLSVWSAACSTGEEPYSIAMVLADVALRRGRFDHLVCASDICTDALRSARRAIYPLDDAQHVPERFRERYLLRGRDPKAALMRVHGSVRRHVSFYRANLLSETPPAAGRVDVVFCRNALIYFDHATQQRVLERLASSLPQGGYLFVGHSESLLGFDVPFQRVATTVYRRTA